MRMTCPYCGSVARLVPNPDRAAASPLPRYVLKCTGCNRTSVREETPDLTSVGQSGARNARSRSTD